jgi:hypothetical protein
MHPNVRALFVISIISQEKIVISISTVVGDGKSTMFGPIDALASTEFFLLMVKKVI